MWEVTADHTDIGVYQEVLLDFSSTVKEEIKMWVADVTLGGCEKESSYNIMLLVTCSFQALTLYCSQTSCFIRQLAQSLQPEYGG